MPICQLQTCLTYPSVAKLMKFLFLPFLLFIILISYFLFMNQNYIFAIDG